MPDNILQEIADAADLLSLDMLFIKPDGDTIIQNQGQVSDSDMIKIRKYIKINHVTMFENWSKYSIHGYYGENK